MINVTSTTELKIDANLKDKMFSLIKINHNDGDFLFSLHQTVSLP